MLWRVVTAWRQGQSYSADLRSRVLAAVDGGMAAWRHGGPSRGFGVSGQHFLHLQGADPASADRSGRGEFAPRPSAAQVDARTGSGSRRLYMKVHDDITLAAAQSWLAREHGVHLSNGAIWTAVDRLGLSFKKNAARQRARAVRRGVPAPDLAGGPALHRS